MANKKWNWLCCFVALVGLFCFGAVANAGHCSNGYVQEVRRESVGYRYVEPVREIRLVERVVVEEADYDYDYADEEVLEVRRVREKQKQNVNRTERSRSRVRSSSRPAKSRSSSSRVVQRSSVSY